MAIRRPNPSRTLDRTTLRELVLTWPVRQLRDVEVPRPDDQDTDPEWSWKYEERYGAPNREDRCVSLQLQLNVLAAAGKNVAAIIAALRQIKGIEFEDALEGFRLDRQRIDAEEADKIRRNLCEWLPRAVQLHERSNPDKLPKGRRFQRTYEAMLTALTFDNALTNRERAKRDWLLAPKPAAMKRRRSKAGGPGGSVVKRAYGLLADAGVSRQQGLPLLSAIGLLADDGLLPKRGNFSHE